jgi:hypothetical protein
MVIDSWHPDSTSGDGILRIVNTNVIIDTQVLREDPDARIITADPGAVCRMLGIPFPDEQVIQEK